MSRDLDPRDVRPELMERLARLLAVVLEREVQRKARTRALRKVG